MSKAARAVHWFRDVAQVIFLDRFNPKRRHLSESASTACRTLNFHSRCKIQALPLAQLLERLGCVPVETVTLPGPTAPLGEVGSQSGYHALGALVRGLAPRTILEFGTYLGVSAYTMALNSPADARIITVDLPDDVSGNSREELDSLDRRHVSTSRHRVGAAFLGKPERERITQIRADSLSFSAQAVVNNADFIYVDGGHSMPVIEKDSENAFSVLAPGGTIVWDDYFHLYPDVVRYLDDLSDRYELHGITGTNYVIFSRRENSTATRR